MFQPLIKLFWCGVCGSLIENDPELGEWLHTDILLDDIHTAIPREEVNWYEGMPPSVVSLRDEPSARCLVCNGWVKRLPSGVWYHVDPRKNDHPAMGPY